MSIIREGLIRRQTFSEIHMLGVTVTQVTQVAGSKSSRGNLKITGRLWTPGRTDRNALKTQSSIFDLHGLPPASSMSN